MPPVAFGDSDSRRWGFQADSPLEGAAGLRWPGSASPNLGVGGGGRAAALEGASDSRLVGGGVIEVALGQTLEDSHHSNRSSFRTSPPDDRGSPGVRPMDPRVVIDANGSIVGGSSSGGAGGGPPSRQGSPFAGGFEGTHSVPHYHHHHHQQQQHMASADASGPSIGGGGSSFGAGRIQHHQQPPRSAGPPRHRSAYDESVGLAQSVEHAYGPSPGSESMSQGSDGSGGVLVGGLGGSGVSSASPGLGPTGGSLGPGSRLAHPPQHGIGTAHLSWHHGQGQHHPRHVQQHQQQQQQQQPQQQQHHLHQQQARQSQQQQHHPQHHLRPSSAGQGADDVPHGRRPSSANTGGGGHSGGGVAGSSWDNNSSGQDMMSMALASVPHGASSLPASAVPTVLERFPGFVRCVMDIAPEVVGWVIGRSGAHIKEMKHRSGCGMWVDQKELKLYITGADMPRIHAAARLVGDLISKAPVNVNSAGVEDEEESRANVVINQKMMKVIVSGIPQSVRLGVAMIEDVITFGRSAEHAGDMASPASFLDFPDAFSGMEGLGGPGEYDVGGADRFGRPPMSGGGRLAPPPPPFAGGPSNSGGGSGGNMSTGAYSGAGSYDGLSRQTHRGSSNSLGHHGSHVTQDSTGNATTSSAGTVIAASASGGGGGTGGGGGQPAEMGYDGKDMDWSVFSASSAMFNISGDSPSIHQQSPMRQAAPNNHPQAPQLSGLPPPSASAGPRGDRENSGHGSRSSSVIGGFAGMSGGGSRAGSVSSGGTPPLIGRSAAPWSILPAGSRAAGSPGSGLAVASAVQSMQRLSINSDDSLSGGQSLGQASRHRERSGTPVGNPVDLVEFLGDMDLGQYARTLMDNEIDLEAVQLMADSDFQDIGIPKGPRVKLLYALRTKRHPPRSGDLGVMRTFLTSLGLERYCKVFEEAEVDMCAIDVMEEADYADLGVAKGPRLKMLNILAKSSSSGAVGMTGGSVGSGSNAGSVSAPSPEPRPSPHPRLPPHSSFQIGSIALGVPASTAASVATVAATTASSAGASPCPPSSPQGASGTAGDHLSPQRSSASASDIASAAAEDLNMLVSSRGDRVHETAPKRVVGREGVHDGGLPPRWDSGTMADRSLSPPAESWMTSALGDSEEAGDLPSA